MATTVQVQEDTLHLLQQERDVSGVDSYDEVIKNLFRKHWRGLDRGLLGKGNAKKFMKGLRDKHDRY